MRAASDEMKQAFASSMEVSYEADLTYDNRQLFTNLPIDAPALTWDVTGEVEGSGRATVVWNDDHGAAIAPHEPQDWLAPFGAQLTVYFRVAALPLERIRLGVFDITSVPQVDEAPFIFGESRVVVGSRVRTVLQDRMREVKRDRFTKPAAPASLTSVYDELARLTGLTITRTLPDVAITRSVVYEENRVAAVQDLAAIAGGVAFMESNGSLSLRPITPGAPVAELNVGPEGTIGMLESSLDSEEVYNGIVIRGETDAQSPILAELWVTDGPLRATPEGGARTPYHRVPRFFSSPFISTQEQAAAAAPGLLLQFSQPQTADLSVQCLINPLLQVGDVVTVDDGLAVWTIRLKKIDLGLSAYMTVVGSVISRVARS